MRGHGVNNKTSWRGWLLAIVFLWLATTVVGWWRDGFASAAIAATEVLVLVLLVAGSMYGLRAWRGVRKTAPLGVQDTLSWRLGQGIHTKRLIGLAPLEQYQTHGLSSPISIWPSWKCI
jgi:hypothetical protein